MQEEVDGVGILVLLDGCIEAGIEGILGFKFKGNNGFTIKPCVPDEWQDYEIFYIEESASIIFMLQEVMRKEFGLMVRKLKIK